MEDRSKLLEQLRIDRAAPPPASAGGGRWRWLAAIGIAVILLAGGFIAWIKVSAADAGPVRHPVAAAPPNKRAATAGGRLHRLDQSLGRRRGADTHRCRRGSTDERDRIGGRRVRARCLGLRRGI